MIDYSKIDDFLEKMVYDGLISFGNALNSNHYYLTRFNCYSNYLFVRSKEQNIALVPPLEKERSYEKFDKTYSTLDYVDSDARDMKQAEYKMISDFLKDNGFKDLAYVGDISLDLYNFLQENGFNIDSSDIISELRTQKNEYELYCIKKIQEKTEYSLKLAQNILEKSRIGPNKELVYNGKVLTSDNLKKKIGKHLIAENCRIREMIIVSGEEGVNPHNYGSGVLKADEPIVIDIFPRDKNTRYWGDFTRTFVKGNISEKIRNMEKATKQAIKTALKNLEKKNITSKQLHNSVCEVFENYGYKTIRNNNATEGFIHSTGHGIGLDLHEAPRISSSNNSPIKPNTVITIEPGLYIKGVGAVRFEDMIIKENNGYTNINKNYPYTIKID